MTITDTAQLVERVLEDPALIFRGDVSATEFLAEAKADALSVGADLSKAKFRDAIKSKAYSISRMRTTIDNVGKDLTEEHRKAKAKVDAVRKMVRDGLTDLQAEVRRPLDQWLAQEEARIASHEATIKTVSDAANVTMEDTAATIGERIDRLAAMDLSEGELQEFAERAQSKRLAAIDYLKSAKARAEKAEAEAAELARLRQAAADREERDRQEAEARERQEREERLAREKAEREAREAEERRQRDAEIARQAEQRAREDAERKIREAQEAAAREREEMARKHEEEIRQREAEAAREEARRRAAEEARQAEARRRQDEEEARARNAAHRETVRAEAVAAISRAGAIGTERADKIFSAICAGDVPHIAVRF
ncbi:coiled-coil domain-containing protein [Acuticoccus sediminis]|uniref:hypothetical protein n=1 Tax=Acuticoccus sediminis TaxID=2184697 RepID=UPI001CFE4962|nr:hypothetical protein [Acuticoccus sediminis]